MFERAAAEAAARVLLKLESERAGDRHAKELQMKEEQRFAVRAAPLAFGMMSLLARD